MVRISPVERSFTRFLRTPLSVRHAMEVIVTATLLSVVLGGVAMRLLDPAEYPDVWSGMWWALQTVTTVGYGDVVPQTAVGRVVGSVVMLESIAFVAIVTAAITSSFVHRARQEQQRSAEPQGTERLERELAAIRAQLARVEAALERSATGGSSEQPSR